MSRFFDTQKNETTREAYQALIALYEAEGGDAVTRLYAELVTEKIEQIYAERHQLTKSTETCLCVLVGKQCPHNSRCVGMGLEAMDHVSVWKRQGKVWSAVLQPYQLHLRGLQQLVTLCNTYQLDIQIDGASWHYPHWSLMIELRKKSHLHLVGEADTT